MKNVVKIFGIPMSPLGGVHLISGIAHFFLQKNIIFMQSRLCKHESLVKIEACF